MTLVCRTYLSMKLEEILIISTSKATMRQHSVPNHPHQYTALEHWCNLFGNDPIKHGVLGLYDLNT